MDINRRTRLNQLHDWTLDQIMRILDYEDRFKMESILSSIQVRFFKGSSISISRQMGTSRKDFWEVIVDSGNEELWKSCTREYCRIVEVALLSQTHNEEGAR